MCKLSILLLLSDLPYFTFSLVDISLSSEIPDLLVTCSTDDTIKYWDIKVCCSTS